jgi:hypothetical protein
MDVAAIMLIAGAIFLTYKGRSLEGMGIVAGTAIGFVTAFAYATRKTPPPA